MKVTTLIRVPICIRGSAIAFTGKLADRLGLGGQHGHERAPFRRTGGTRPGTIHIVGVEPLTDQQHNALAQDRALVVQAELERGAEQDRAQDAGTEPRDAVDVAAFDETVDDELLKLQWRRRERSHRHREDDQKRLLTPVTRQIAR